MRFLLAIFLPWLQFFTIGRPFAGLFCLLLLHRRRWNHGLGLGLGEGCGQYDRHEEQ